MTQPSSGLTRRVDEAAKPIMLRALTIQPDVHAWLAKVVKVRYDIDLAPK